MILKTSLLLLIVATSINADWEHERLVSNFNKRSLLYVRSPGSSSSQSRSSLPWRYLQARNVAPTSTSDESTQDSSAAASLEVPVQKVQVNSVESEETSSSVEVPQQVPIPVQVVPIVAPSQKGESGTIVLKKRPSAPQDSDSEEDEVDERDVVSSVANDLITFSYYPIAQQYDRSGAIVYEIQDSELRTARGGGKGKGKKKGCKKGKKGKKGRKGKGKKKKGKKGCSIKGGWWYVWDKKHGYISGRWGTPPPKGLEREHYWHNYGKHGHGYGQGYDGHGHMGWKVNKGWGGHGGGHGGGYGGGGGGGGGGFGGYGGGGYGGGHHGGHHGGGHHGGWGVPHQHYGWGWAEKVKGWGWKR